jgi:hypothetical protein
MVRAMPRRGRRGAPEAGELGQASLLFLGVLAALLAGTLILFGFGQALGARGKHQRAADLAAVSAAQVMSRQYGRLFEPAVFENGLPNPRHLSNEQYLALARAAALRGARRNGVAASRVEVDFPAADFAPTQIEVSTSGEARVRLGERPARERIPVAARATAEIAPDLNVAFGMPTHGTGGGYDGPLAYRMGKPMRPDVAAAFDRMAAAAPAPTSPSAPAFAPTWPPPSTAWPPRPAAKPASTSPSAPAFAPTPNSRCCGTRIPTPNGSPLPAPACTATPPSSTSAPRSPTRGWPSTTGASASS